ARVCGNLCSHRVAGQIKNLRYRLMISRITMTSQMIASNKIAPMIWLRERRMRGSIHLREFDPGVINLQNLFDVQSLLRQSVSAELAHPDAMPPTAARKDERRHVVVIVINAIDDEELFLQSQRRPNAATANVSDALRADD